MTAIAVDTVKNLLFWNVDPGAGYLIRKLIGLEIGRGTALVVFLYLCLVSNQAFCDTFWWLDDEQNSENSEIVEVDGPEIREPFFAFLVAAAEGDSLGTWPAETIAAKLKECGRESRFPVDQIVSITRRQAKGSEQESRLGESVERVWELELASDLDRPMPYSILGYHPGSLRVSKRLVLSEWNLGRLDLIVPTDEDSGRIEHLENVMIMRLDEGHIILDVDGWLDALLGKGLDDAWTLGMALARHNSNPIGLAISIGRNDRHIFGELDFKSDEVKAHGSPIARTLSRHGRHFTAPHPEHLNIPWAGDF